MPFRQCRFALSLVALLPCCGGGSGTTASGDAGPALEGGGPSSGCSGTLSGPLSATFTCTALLAPKNGGGDVLRFFIDQSLPGRASLALDVSLAAGALAPGTYSAAELTEDSVASLITTAPTVQYVTHGGTPPTGASLNVTVASADPAPAAVLDPAPDTHGTIHATLVGSDPQAATESLDLSF